MRDKVLNAVFVFPYQIVVFCEGISCVCVSVGIEIKTQIAHLFQICQGFIFFFKEVHLYRCQIHTPTGFLHCYRVNGWWDTGTWWVQYSTNKLAGNCCPPPQDRLSEQVCADVQFSATVWWAKTFQFSTWCPRLAEKHLDRRVASLRAECSEQGGGINWATADG